MAEAILRGVLQSGTLDAGHIAAYEKDEDRIKYIVKTYRIFFFRNLRDLIQSSSYILIAVKPQNVPGFLKEAQCFLNENKNTIISIAAGVPTWYFERNLKKNISVIRVMPNTPALLNKGMSALSAGRFAKESDLGFTEKIMKCIGDCITVDEKLQNAVTAVSGSGPAYFFLFCRSLINTAVRKGIPENIAVKLVLKTMDGSGAMMEAFNCDTEGLIKMVKSPGGTTEAALNKFSEKNFEGIINEAVENAVIRAVKIQDSLENI